MEMMRGETVPGAIRLLFEVGTVAGMSDGQLLDRFLDRRGDEEAAEVAFAALVERHGPMVLRACRARLGDEHDAQDAFQATFLILARKAGSIRKHESAASWLLGVARRVASCARRAAAVRRAKERKAAGGKVDLVAEADRSDLVPAVREEVGDLPEKYRTPLMLCLLDGLTHEQAATRLGWPVGTVKTRVRRAKDRLRVALTRRGLAPSLGAIAAALSAQQASAMPATLVRATTRAALGFEMGRSTALLSASVAKLVELGMGSLIMPRFKMAALAITTVGVLAAGTATGLARLAPKAQEKPAGTRPVEKDAAVPKPDAAGKEALDPIEAAREERLDAIEAAQAERLERIEASKLDIELLQMEVNALRFVVTRAMNECMKAKEGVRSLIAPPNPQTFGGGGFQPLAGQDLEDAKKKGQEYLDYTMKRLEETRAAYLSKNRELKREQRRLEGLQDPAVAAVNQVLRAMPSPAPKLTADLERRLSDVERKLDLILKALEKQGREPGRE